MGFGSKKGITISRQMPKANHLFNTTNIGDLYIIAKLICKKFYKKNHVFSIDTTND
jgi:hypothetical protein